MRTFLSSLFRSGNKTELRPKSFGLTDVGVKRNHNEDSIFSSDDLRLYLVADGMGGHAYGEVASAMAVRAIVEELKEKKKDSLPFIISDSIRKANQNIHSRSREQLDRDPSAATLTAGMGTTIVALYHNEETDRVSLAHVGDSRIYRFRNSKIELLTTDHSISAMLAKSNSEAVKESVVGNRFKNMITRALGLESQVQVDLKEERVLEKDLFLLCSDGLTNMVPEEQIQNILQSEKLLPSACKLLIDTANRNGGKDNISAILIQFYL